MEGVQRNMMKKKSRSNVYVDYQYWYYSYKKNLNMAPNLEEWYVEIQKTYCVEKIMIFGNFGIHAMADELAKIKTITDDIVNTVDSKVYEKKNNTDYFILDSIYRDGAKRRNPDIYIIFTGSNHFELVIQYLKDLGKQVLVYGVKNYFSETLKSCSDFYVEMPRYIQEKQFYFDLIFEYLKEVELKGIRDTYNNTIKRVAKYNEIADEPIQSALDELLESGYIVETCESYNERECRLLSINWYEAIKSGVCRRFE